MCLNLKRSGAIIALIVTSNFACTSADPPPVLSPHEQMTVDTNRTQTVLKEFEKQVHSIKSPAVTQYLVALTRQIASVDEGFKKEKITVRIHDDSNPEWKRIFSFPGIILSLPISFLKSVNFENELAAMISIELAHVKRRDLATRMDDVDQVVLLGAQSIFKFDSKTNSETIVLGTSLLYNSGYDPRGMVALFQKYSGYYLSANAPGAEKELASYIKEAQRAKNEFMPSLQPIVRSDDFLRMKKGLNAHE